MANITKSIKSFFEKNGTKISLYTGVIGLLVTPILSVLVTPKALKAIDREKDEQEVEKLTPIETIKVTWKYYVGPMAIAAASTCCILGASSRMSHRGAAVAAAYALKDSELKAYKKKVIDTVGKRKEQDIRDEIAKDKIENNLVNSSEENVIFTGKGDTLCYDAISGRCFKSDIEVIKKIVNELNRSMLYDMYISLNEFYYEIGLPMIKLGDELGWNVDSGLIEIEFSSQLTPEGKPCLVIDYDLAPKRGYQD